MGVQTLWTRTRLYTTPDHVDDCLSEPAGAILESNYFNTKQPPIAGIRALPCGIQTILFQKTRLNRACD